MYDARTFAFQVSEALDGIRRTGVGNLATVTTVALSLFILGSYLLGLRNVNAFLDRLQSSYEVTLFLAREAGPTEVGLVRQNLEIDPAVVSATYVPKDAALSEIAARFRESGQSFPELARNPLPDAFRVLIQEGADFDAFRTRATALPGVSEVSSGDEWVSRALRVVKIARVAGLLMILVLGGASLLIIANTIQLTVHARRDEISIMQLVGATNWFLRVPFLIEGFLQGVAGALLAILALLGLYSFLVEQVLAVAPFVPMVTDGFELARLAAQLLLMGMILGLLGALLSLRRILV